MEEVCGYLNLSNSSVTEYGNLSRQYCHPCHPHFVAFQIVVFVVLAAVIAFNGLIAVMLLRSPSVSARVRVPLLNLLVAILISAVLLLCRIIITLAVAQTVPDLLLWILVMFGGSYPYSSFVQIARLLGLLLLLVMAFQMVACGTRKIPRKWLVLSLVAIWVIAVLIPSVLIISTIITITVNRADAISLPGSLAIPFLLIWVIMLAILVLCICTVVATLCYIKRHTNSEAAQYKKSMAKFVAFLIAINGLNVLAQVVNWAVAYLELVSNICILIFITYTITILSFIPTPLLIVVFLKPVQKRMQRLFCCKFQNHNETIAMQQERMS